MSSAEFQLDLSPQAQRDLIDILRYTGKKWGLDQLLAYRDKLNEALRLLKQNPEIGQESPGGHPNSPTCGRGKLLHLNDS
jgi:plasmid stabilization system protein ParE